MIEIKRYEYIRDAGVVEESDRGEYLRIDELLPLFEIITAGSARVLFQQPFDPQFLTALEALESFVKIIKSEIKPVVFLGKQPDRPLAWIKKIERSRSWKLKSRKN